MNEELYLKRKIFKNKNILFYSLIFIKRYKTLYYFDIVNFKDENNFDVIILNKSSKENLIEQLKDMFNFNHEVFENYDYQEIQLTNKLKIETTENIGHPILGYKKINGKQKLIFISNYYKDWVLKI